MKFGTIFEDFSNENLRNFSENSNKVCFAEQSLINFLWPKAIIIYLIMAKNTQTLRI